MATYGYTRVSTARQAEHGESLEVQERTLHGYAMMHGMEMARVFIERGVSGSVPLGDRPEGAALLAILKPGDAVVVPKLDRMFRSATDALSVIDRLKKRGVGLHMIDLGGDVTGNGISRLVFTILAAVAEAERDRIRERVAQVKADQKDRGRFLGGYVPFGYRRDGEMVVEDEAAQGAIRRAVKMRGDGAALRPILTALHADGHRLSLPALHRVLREADEAAAKEAARVAQEAAVDGPTRCR